MALRQIITPSEAPQTGLVGAWVADLGSQNLAGTSNLFVATERVATIGGVAGRFGAVLSSETQLLTSDWSFLVAFTTGTPKATGVTAVLGRGPSTGGNNTGYGLHAVHTNAVYAGAVYSGSGYSVIGKPTGGALANNTRYVIGASRFGTVGFVYNDGVKTGSATGLSTTNLTGRLVLGSDSTLTDLWIVPPVFEFIFVWNRPLSDDEFSEYSRDPRLVYEQHLTWVPVGAGGGGSAITAAAGSATASTLAGASSAAAAFSAAAGAATGSSLAGASSAAAAITAADGVATASTMVGVAGAGSAITAASGVATTATMAGASSAVATFTAAAGVATAGTLAGVGDVAGTASIVAAAGVATSATMAGASSAAATITVSAGVATAATMGETVTAYTSAGVLYIPIRMVSALWNASGVGGGDGQIAWLPPQRQPVAYLDARSGTYFCDPAWYLFFEYVAEQKLGGRTGPTLPAVVDAVTTVQTVSAAAASTVTELQQQTSANAESLYAVKTVAKLNLLEGWEQIPDVEL